MKYLTTSLKYGRMPRMPRILGKAQRKKNNEWE